jgi:hypothetical protein
MPKEYAQSVAEFIKKGGVISWGIVPTESPILANQTPEKLASILSNYWEVISENTGLALKQIADQALIAPARCCLRDIATETTGICEIPYVEEEIVEKAFAFLPEISKILKEKFEL